MVWITNLPLQIDGQIGQRGAYLVEMPIPTGSRQVAGEGIVLLV